MNLHDVQNKIRGTLFRGISELHWGQIVRTAEGKSHLFEMPVTNGWVAMTTYPEMFPAGEPVPWCGKKTRRGASPMRYLYAQKTWRGYCEECNAYAHEMHITTKVGYWHNIRTDEDLADFITYAATNPRA